MAYSSGCFVGKRSIWTAENLEDLGNAIIEWAKTTSHAHVSGFCIDHGKDWDNLKPSYLRVLYNRYPDLKHFVTDAREILAARIIQRSFETKASPYVLKTLIPMYDKEIREHEDSRELFTHKLGKDGALQGKANELIESLKELAENREENDEPA